MDLLWGNFPHYFVLTVEEWGRLYASHQKGVKGLWRLLAGVLAQPGTARLQLAIGFAILLWDAAQGNPVYGFIK